MSFPGNVREVKYFPVRFFYPALDIPKDAPYTPNRRILQAAKTILYDHVALNLPGIG